jgi:hypothetical protein
MCSASAKIILILFLIQLSCNISAKIVETSPKYDLKGHFKEMVIAVGFNDGEDGLIEYPKMSTQNVRREEDNYPFLGRDINGHVPDDPDMYIDSWYKEAFDTYYDSAHYGGRDYTVEFVFPFRKSGNKKYVYTTKHTKEYFLSSGKRINNETVLKIIFKEVMDNMLEQDSTYFDDIDALHFFFEVKGFTKDDYSTNNAGGGVIYYFNYESNPERVINKIFAVTHQYSVDCVMHERLHIIGWINYYATGISVFGGLPDRGDIARKNHFNQLGNYDIMDHRGYEPARYSLYGLKPITLPDVISFGWIKPSEIVVVNENSNDSTNIKLADVMNSLEINNGPEYKVAKVIINNYENTTSGDEYFLVEYHKGSSFDKNFSSRTGVESGDTVNTGLLIWHIKENKNEDDIIDLEIARPFGGSFPPFFCSNWGGIYTGEYDYLDEMEYNDNPKGGVHYWKESNPELKNYSSLPSDFFKPGDKFTPYTSPSTVSWKGNFTGINVKNIKYEQDGKFISFDVTRGKITPQLPKVSKKSDYEAYSLSQNYPNPFNPLTLIRFDLPNTSWVSISIYNLAGELVRKLLYERLDAGHHEVKFDATNLTSGVYVCVFQANGFKDTKKMLLLK